MSSNPSIFDIAIVFISSLKTIDIRYLIPLGIFILYYNIYYSSLKHAALRDPRNNSWFLTRYYARVILRERLSKGNVAAWIFLICFVGIVALLFIIFASLIAMMDHGWPRPVLPT